MKVLVVTGLKAQDLVKLSAKGADVLVLDVDVAAFITPEMLLRAAPRGYDLILIPGAITADFSIVEKALNTRIRLGPKHAIDLGVVLRHLGDLELSRSIPACVLMEETMKKDAEDELMRLEAGAEAGLAVSGVKIGGNSRMKVLAEIVDATLMTPQALSEKIRYYIEQGADMIDLGLPLDAHPVQVAAALETARDATALPISVDTVRPDLIRAGLEAGADLVLSLNAENLNQVGEDVALSKVPAVVIPGPEKASLAENVRSATSLGIKVIADPVLDPPLQGMASSLERYNRFHRDFPDIPLFFGAGNVTELLDADTQGSNALLAALGAEVKASILFTPEYSPKARGSIRELRRASEMMFLAQKRKTPPKDLGIDLLILKEKRRLPEVELPSIAQEAKTDHPYQMDPSGSFRICLAGGKILAMHEKAAVMGTKARDMLNTLIDSGLVSRLDHAGYLGRELEKAELALRLGKAYIQDEPLLPEKS